MHLCGCLFVIVTVYLLLSSWLVFIFHILIIVAVFEIDLGEIVLFVVVVVVVVGIIVATVGLQIKLAILFTVI